MTDFGKIDGVFYHFLGNYEGEDKSGGELNVPFYHFKKQITTTGTSANDILARIARERRGAAGAAAHDTVDINAQLSAGHTRLDVKVESGRNLYVIQLARNGEKVLANYDGDVSNVSCNTGARFTTIEPSLYPLHQANPDIASVIETPVLFGEGSGGPFIMTFDEVVANSAKVPDDAALAFVVDEDKFRALHNRWRQQWLDKLPVGAPKPDWTKEKFQSRIVCAINLIATLLDLPVTLTDVVPKKGGDPISIMHHDAIHEPPSIAVTIED